MTRDAARDDRRNRELLRLQTAVAKQRAEMGGAQPVDSGGGQPWRCSYCGMPQSAERLRCADCGAAKPDDPQAKHVKPTINMPADDVLILPGFAKRDAVQKPTNAGWDRNGMIVKWHYPDLTLTLRRYGEPFCYRVSEVEERGSDGQEK